LPDLICAGGEERPQIESFAHGGDDLGKSGLGADLLAFLFGFGLGLEAG
jgi:hypothetical protein